jgi:hypothetical protein
VKFMSKVIIAMLLASILVVGEARKVRRTRTKVSAGEWIKAAMQGFLSGIADASGQDINDCLPDSMQGNYLAQDESDPDVKEKDVATKTTFGYILKGMKYALDIACAFISQLESLFNFSLRRRLRRRHRRIFFAKRMSRKRWDWFNDICNSVGKYVKEKVGDMVDWASEQFDNFKKWTVDAWNSVTSWVKDQWDKFWAKLEAVRQKVEEVKTSINDWITNTAMPIVIAIFKCTKIILSIIGTITSVVKAVIEIMAGNVIKVVNMIIQMICNYQTIIDLYTEFVKIVDTTGTSRAYSIGKFVGMLLRFFGAISGFKPKKSDAKSDPFGAMKKMFKGKTGAGASKLSKLSSVVNSSAVENLDKVGEIVGIVDTVYDTGDDVLTKLSFKKNESNVYRIINKTTGYCLGVEGNTNERAEMEVDKCMKDSDSDRYFQQWHLEEQADKTAVFRIKNKQSKRNISVKGSSKKDNIVIYQVKYNAEKKNRFWEIRPVGDVKRFSWVVNTNSGKCMSIRRGDDDMTNRRRDVRQLTCDMKKPQMQWRFEKVDEAAVVN